MAFMQNGAACKHLWALRVAIPKLIQANSLEPPVFAWRFPESKSDAWEIYKKCFPEYSDQVMFDHVKL